MTRNVAISIAARLYFVAATVAFLTQVAAVADLYAFEFPPLIELLGKRGIVLILILDSALLYSIYRSVAFVWRRRRTAKVLGNALIVVAAILGLWTFEWMFIERPVTVQLLLALRSETPPRLSDREARDFADFSLAKRARDPAALSGLRTAYARVLINNPAAFRRHPIGSTIDRYAQKFDVDPVLLFTICYLDSFYGEATSGPIPLLGAMTSETIRDVVQVHLPAWYIESSLRRALVSGGLMQDAFGDALGFKLRYAIHKANLDVSSQPYSASTYSVTFMVLREYPEEFTDILDPGSNEPLHAALRDSYLALRHTALLPPYESPYGISEYSADYYDTHRDNLKRFARAAYYLSVLDFDFATRVQAVLLKYRRDYYRARVGEVTWERMPIWQQNALLTMVQDVYKPNVGTLAYNLYALPELTATALEFVASEAAKAPEAFQLDQAVLWRPRNYEVLWGGAGYQMAVLNEIWLLLHRDPIPGIGSTGSLEYSAKIVGLAQAYP